MEEPQNPAWLLTIPGPPPSKGRPRLGRRGIYTPDATRAAERAIQALWIASGLTGVGVDTPLCMSVCAYFRRPGSHYLKDGSLSKKGLVSDYPLKRPDIDNIEKIVFDALQGYAYPNDVQIVQCFVVKHWANTPDLERTDVRLWVADRITHVD